MGIEIRDRELVVTVARVRPSGVSVLGSATVLDYAARPASEWGAELAAFLRTAGAAHIAAAVLVPRREVIVRHLEMRGVKDRDLASAVQFQLEGLHPFSEEEAIHSFARIKGTDTVLVGITRREVVDRYAVLLAEAGVRVAAFTFSAAAVYSALRIPASAPKVPEFVAVYQSPASFELYGESPSYPVFSSSFDAPSSRAVEMATAELRLPPDSAPVLLTELLPSPVVYPVSPDSEANGFAAHVLPYAAALENACPWLGLPVNLLPEEHRRTSSRVRYIPTAVLASALALLVIGLIVQGYIMDTRYLNLLDGEVRKLEIESRRSTQLERKTAQVRARTFLLDEFKRRSKKDLDALNELTKVMEPPAWLASLELTRTEHAAHGETQAAAGLRRRSSTIRHTSRTRNSSPVSSEPRAERPFR